MTQTNKPQTVISVLGSEIYYLTYDGSKLIRIEKETPPHHHHTTPPPETKTMITETALFCPSLPTKDTTYNGWTNYATWRVNLEMFDGVSVDYFMPYSSEEVKSLDVYDVAEHLKEQASEMLESENALATSYALAFLSEVNFHEIAESMMKIFNEDNA